MTNGEKFEEVFGMRLKTFPADPCNIVDDAYTNCLDKLCADCELCHFWDKEYIENDEDREDREDALKVFTLGALFGFVGSDDVITLDMIEKELKNKEVKKMTRAEENAEMMDGIYKQLNEHPYMYDVDIKTMALLDISKKPCYYCR